MTTVGEAWAWLAGWWRGRNRAAPWASQAWLVLGELGRFARAVWRCAWARREARHGGRGSDR